MNDLTIHLTTATTTRILHARSGAVIDTAIATEAGGSGGAFSSTDLLAAALGSCIATNLGPVAERHGIPLDIFEITVSKALGQQPKRVTRLAVEIRSRTPLDPDMLVRFERAAESCTVLRSLHPDLEHTVHFVPPDSPDTPDTPDTPLR